MSLPLPAGVPFAYSLTPDTTVEVAVVSGGPVEYGPNVHGGMGEVDGIIEMGDSLTLTVPGLLRAQDDAEVDLTYPVPEPTPGPPPEDAPDGDGDGDGDGTDG